MIVGIGMDLCEIGRMGKAIERAHFVDRVFTASEAARVRGASEHRAAEIATGLFAAKEAVSKALGTGFAGFGPDAIEITPDDAGRPRCTLLGKALERARALCGGDGFTVWVSVTHEGGVAGAMAVIERQDKESELSPR